MRIHRFACLCIACILGLGASRAQTAAPTATATPAAESTRPGDSGQRWRIEFDRTAKSDGEIRFRLWPYRADPIDLVLPVKKGQTENALARETRDLMRDTLDNNEYRVELAKQFVAVTAIRGERRFALELAASTAEGVDIDLYREGR